MASSAALAESAAAELVRGCLATEAIPGIEPTSRCALGVVELSSDGQLLAATIGDSSRIAVTAT